MNTFDIENFLADTWWYGLTIRLSEKDFRSLALLRVRQGFSFVQLVVGIPPEIGPENKNAKSIAGFPWNLKGNFNQEYLELARQRIKFLNKVGLKVIVYGAWGHQVEWLDRSKMLEWWLKIIKYLDDLDVLYCLTGEADLWIGEENFLLPSKSTQDLRSRKFLKLIYKKSPRLIAKGLNFFREKIFKKNLEKRKKDWNYILEKVSDFSTRPFLIHTTPDTSGYEFIKNHDLLAANTVQTGHEYSTKNLLWRLPYNFISKNPKKNFINLEPWYEGIKNQFWAEDQLFSYWVSMLSGSSSYCYGAHGIWNVGDGKFLAQWGKQTFKKALASDTPRLIGLSHKEYVSRKIQKGETFFKARRDVLITIGKKFGDKAIHYFPEISLVNDIPSGKIWLPLKGFYVKKIPSKGQVVIFSN